MSNRIVATFSEREIKNLGEDRFSELMKALTPSLSVLAGEPVFWQRTTGGFLVLARARRQPIPGAVVKWTGPGSHRIVAEGTVVHIDGSVAWVRWRIGNETKPGPITCLAELEVIDTRPDWVTRGDDSPGQDRA